MEEAGNLWDGWQAERNSEWVDGLSKDTTDYLKDQALVVLAYVGIVVTFAAASLIGSVIWLLIW